MEVVAGIFRRNCFLLPDHETNIGQRVRRRNKCFVVLGFDFRGYYDRGQGDVVFLALFPQKPWKVFASVCRTYAAARQEARCLLLRGGSTHYDGENRLSRNRDGGGFLF